MATKENINWKRINMGEILPCQSFLRKKNGEILKLSTVGGVKVGQDCYYLPVDEVINIIKDYPVEESEDERIRCTLINHFKTQVDLSRTWNGLKIPDIIAWLEKQGEQKHTAEEILIKAGLKPYKDGDQWCVLLGDNIQEGICGFGNTIEDALYAFLKDLVASQGKHKPIQEYDDMAYEMARAVLYDKLKDSLRPQSHWRPSDAQMKQLGWIAEQNKDNMIGKELMTLYQDLKKLRGNSYE